MSEALLEIYNTLDVQSRQEVDRLILDLANKKDENGQDDKFMKSLMAWREKYRDVIEAPGWDEAVDAVFNNPSREIYEPKNVWD